MLYIESPHTDPHFNLAMEQYLFDTIGRDDELFFLWQNANAIIVGKNQNTEAEINKAFVAEKEIKVVRRLSGGGAVYHDLGNLNFTFIVDARGKDSLDLRLFCEPVQKLLQSMGIDAQISGRNDITIGGKKFSGNAQYLRDGRCLHHGTILFDTNLETAAESLLPSGDKLQSKGIASVRSRITNVREHLATTTCTLSEFKEKLKLAVLGSDFTQYHLTEADLSAVAKLQTERYATWDWNFGSSPRFSLQKSRRIDGCGKIELHLDVKNGLIEALRFFGDFFGSRETSEIAAKLVGCRLEVFALREVLDGIDVGQYFHNLTVDELVRILCE